MGILKYNILIIIVLSVFYGCKPKQEPISFMLLDKHSGKKPSSFRDDIYIYIYREVYLIDNLPESQKVNIESKVDTVLYNIEFDFFKKNNKICLLENDITEYEIRLYKKSKCTKYFIENLNDYGGISRSTLSESCEDDNEYSFYYKRDNKNPSIWTNTVITRYWGEKYADTIYCNPNHKKVKLPDMPD